MSERISSVHWEEDMLINSEDKRETKTMIEYVGAVEKQTLENTYFRQVLFTAHHARLDVMCLQPGEGGCPLIRRK